MLPLLLLLAAPAPPILVEEPGGPRLFLPPIVQTAEPEYYGHQTLIARGIGLGIGLLGFAFSQESPEAMAVFGTLGGLVFTLGPAVVHAINGEYFHAGLSAGLNLLVPGGLAAIGLGIGMTDDSLGGALAGLLVGGGLAMAGTVVLVIVDATALGYKTLPDVVPSVSVAPDGSLLPGLAMTF